jgi:hypothetical protein
MGVLTQSMYRFQFDFTPLDLVALDQNFISLATAVDYLQQQPTSGVVFQAPFTVLDGTGTPAFEANVNGGGSIGPPGSQISWDSAGNFTMTGNAKLELESLANLSDVALNNPQAGQLLMYTGIKWTNAPVGPGGIAGTGVTMIAPFNVIAPGGPQIMAVLPNGTFEVNDPSGELMLWLKGAGTDFPGQVGMQSMPSHTALILEPAGGGALGTPPCQLTWDAACHWNWQAGSIVNAPTPAPGTNTTQLATTAFVQTAVNEGLTNGLTGASVAGPNGYVVLPGGILMQWGYAQGPGPSPAEVGPIAFPRHFSATPWAAVCSTNRSHANGAAVSGSGFVFNLTAQSMSCVFDSLDGQPNAMNGGYWLVVGPA